MNHRTIAGAAAALVTALALLPGCAAFQSSRKIDMTPFAENTAAMFAEAAKVGRPPQWNHLKKYQRIPELQAVRQRAELLIRGLRGIVLYSNQLVALNLSSKSDKEKNRLLSAYFREAAAKVAEKHTFDSIGFGPSALDTVYAAIERAESFREGIEAAGPLVNAVVIALLNRVDEIDATVPVVIGAFDREVDDDFGVQRRNYEALVHQQANLHRAVALLYEARAGNRAACDTLLTLDPSMREFLASPEKAGSEDYRAADDALTTRLERITAFIGQLQDEKTEYNARLQEIVYLRANVDERLKIARDAVMLWSQSHRNLGAGIAVPPLIDVGGIAGGLAKKVVPLP
jgi:hypothetical protein